MGSGSKLKESAKPPRLLRTKGAPAAESGADGGNASRPRSKTSLIPLDRIDRLLQRSVQVNDAIALQDDGKNIAVLWNSKRLGDVRRAYLAKVRDTDARVGRIARTELKPTLVSIRLG